MAVDDAQAAEALRSPRLQGLDEDREALLADALGGEYSGHRLIATDDQGNAIAGLRWTDPPVKLHPETGEPVPPQNPQIRIQAVASVPGSGAGTRLIGQVAAIADERYVPISLESSELNDDYYRGLGFERDKKGYYYLTPIKARALARSLGITHEDPSKDFRVLEDTGKPGDGHIRTADGARLWGKYGASGVMIRHVDSDGTERFLLVQRGKSVSSNRWKWQLPGGAIDSNENDYQGAARELSEELEPPQGYLSKIKARGEVVFNHPSGWHYTNIAADVPEMFDAHPDGTETNDAQWFTRDEIAKLPLQPAFRENLNNLMDEFGSLHVDLPETPVEPDLSKWEPELHQEVLQDEHTETLPDVYYSDDTLDLEGSRTELLERMNEYQAKADAAKKRGDSMDAFLWQSRHDHLKSQIDASGAESDIVPNRAEEAPRALTPATVDSVTDLVKRANESVVYPTALGYRGERAVEVAPVRDVAPTPYQGTVVPEPAEGAPGNALADYGMRGGNGPLVAGYSTGQKVIYDGQAYSVLGAGRQGSATVKINYSENGMDVHVKNLFPLEDVRTPTSHVPADVSGASAMTLDMLGFSKGRRKLLDRHIKNSRVTLDSQNNVGPGESQALADLMILKQQGLQSAGAAMGFEPKEVDSGIRALQDALASWSMMGNLRDTRLMLHEAMRNVRAGKPASTDLERGLLMQKAWTSAVWKQKYGSVNTVKAVRVISGDYADRMRIMDEATREEHPARRDRANWELTQYEMTSWAVPEARDRLIRNWLRDQRGAIMEKEFSRDEAWLLVWGESHFRSWGLKAPGEVIVDDRTPLTRDNIDLEYVDGESYDRYHDVRAGRAIQNYAAWLRVMPQTTIEDVAIHSELTAPSHGGSGLERLNTARSFIFTKGDPSEFLDVLDKAEREDAYHALRLVKEREEASRTGWRLEQIDKELEKVEKTIPYSSKLMAMIADSGVDSVEFQVQSAVMQRILDAQWNLYYLNKDMLPGFTYGVKTRAEAQDRLVKDRGVYTRVQEESRNAIVALWMKRGMTQAEAEEHYRELSRRLDAFMDTIDTTGAFHQPKSVSSFPEEAP